jgi:hypothetical protein
MKNGIRGSEKHLVVGIDIAKERQHAFFGIPTVKTLLRRFVFDNRREGFEKLCLHAEIIKQQHGLDIIVFGMGRFCLRYSPRIPPSER